MSSSEAAGSQNVREPLYVVRGLCRRFGERAVLDGLSFEVLRGECLVVLGRSGSGKSLTLRQLNGLDPAEGGEVLFEGTDLVQLTERELYPVRRRIAMLFQSGALFDSFDVLENVAFPIREHERASEEEVRDRVAAALAWVGLSGIEDRMPAALSGGMKKRVALARSLVLEPEVVLFDEPTAGLDPVTAATISRLIRSTRDELGTTSVVVTHDIRLARHVGDRLALLQDGRFRFLGCWKQAERSTDPALRAFLEGRSGPEQEDIDAA
ncbi:MAG: ATP-binding cassette domain-containing protein [Acidobacteria bacterium]|nr:ATP-binding cassette domain-containing protein [Acidobacteriota bacterium]